MIPILTIAVCLVFLVSSALSLLFNVHMFQLNGYKSLEHLRWIAKNKAKFLPQYACILVVAIVLFLQGNLSVAALAAFFAITCFAFKRGKQKKPLVYTMRVKRLLATLLVILLCVVVIAALGTATTAILLLGVAYVLLPIIVIVANFINKPIEYAVNQHYINDAKKILASHKNLVIIGVTGSYGKTSVKYYLSALLRAQFNVLMTPESYNTPMGIVKTIRGHLKATHEIFVCEMGARYVGEIKELCDIVHPHHGVITSIGPQHLETFKSIENIEKTKFELADSLPASGILFLNCDNDIIKNHNMQRSYISYGLNSANNFSAKVLGVSEKGTSFNITAPSGETCNYTTNLIGEHNVVNILAAIAISNTLGIALEALITPVRKLESVPHRLQLSHGANNTIIIDDAYNSNPSGTKVALDTLNHFDGAKIIVTPGMVELGAKQDEYNFQFGCDIAKVCDYAVLVGARQTQSILNGLKSVGFDEKKILVAQNIDEALSKVYAIETSQKKIVLLENDLPDNY